MPRRQDEYHKDKVDEFKSALKDYVKAEISYAMSEHDMDSMGT